MGLDFDVASRYTYAVSELADMLARFIVGGALIVVASDWLTPYSTAAKAFFLSRAWPVLRYAVICAAVVLCVLVLRSDGS